jgi:Mrp family chromosome partitioning ATPase
MVVEESGTSRDDILRAAHMLSSVELIGTVLNKSAVPQTTGYAPIKKPGNFFTRLFRRD